MRAVITAHILLFAYFLFASKYTEEIAALSRDLFVSFVLLAVLPFMVVKPSAAQNSSCTDSHATGILHTIAQVPRLIGFQHYLRRNR